MAAQTEEDVERCFSRAPGAGAQTKIDEEELRACLKALVATPLNGAGAVSASVATASTHKVAVQIGETTYYLLMTNVP